MAKYEETKALLDATLKIISATRKQDEGVDTEVLFLKLFIEALVTKVLDDRAVKSLPKQEQFNVVKKNYETLKLCIQEAVAVGFQDAIQRFAKMPIEYYCLIKTVPEVTNNRVH